MFILKCALCGREQIVKKRLDKYTYSLLTQNNGLLCGCKDCDSYSNYKTPKGQIRHCFVLGNWSVIRPMSIEDYKGIKRANAILEMGLQQLQRKGKI